MRINGKPGNLISATDRGFQYGDGLFETLAVVGGEPCLWAAHMERLETGCRRLGISMPDRDGLLREARQEIGGEQHGVLKILVSRGAGGRGYRPPRRGTPTRIVSLFPWPDYPQQWSDPGIRLRVCRTRLGTTPALAGLKHLNRLEQVLARAEWDDPSIAEGLMLDTADRVIEGTMANLFALREGRLYTPALQRCGVAGVLRALVMEVAAAQGLAVLEQDLEMADLLHSDALFLTNSLIGVWPVRQMEDRHFNPRLQPRTLWREIRGRAFAGMNTRN